MEIARLQLQPLPGSRRARRSPQPQGRQETCRRAPGRVGPAVLEVGGEFYDSDPDDEPGNGPLTDSMAEQNGKQGDAKNLAQANAAAAVEAAGTSS